MKRDNIAGILQEVIHIRHRLHQTPEIGLLELDTSAYIAGQLEAWGFKVQKGFAKTGFVASLKRGNSTKAIAFRADIDGLPIVEKTGLVYASRNSGAMHACGHDGHSAMLLGAAYVLAHHGIFDGQINFIFQPAEENAGGAKLMIEDGLFDHYPSDLLIALHNMPGMRAGSFATRVGPMMASIDVVTITIHGVGGHGAQPEEAVDPIVVGSSIVMALQSVVSRNVSPHAPSVITVGQFHAGTASNIIPSTATLDVSMRAVDPETRDLLRNKVEQVARAQAHSFGASASFEWQVGYPPTINGEDAVKLVEQVVTGTFGSHQFEFRSEPMMASEDCSFLLEKVPGAFVFIGNGESSSLHSDTYDFNDDILENGIRFFCAMAEAYLEAR
jgi:hippurate hydrolase